jgi:hypothetical protein
MSSTANIKSVWTAGSLYFKSLLTNTVVMELNAVTGTVDMPATRKVVRVPLVPGAANAYAFAFQNPESANIIIERVMVNITTAGGTAGALLNVGTGATATTASSNLLTGLNINQTGVYDNLSDAGASGKSRALLNIAGGATSYITGQITTANASALAGTAYIVYFTV